MENKTLTSALALTFFIAGSAAFSMQEITEETKSETKTNSMTVRFFKNTLNSDITAEELNNALQSATSKSIIEEKVWKVIPVELGDAGSNRPAKSKIVKGKNGEITVTTDCSKPSLSQIRTANFDVKEGENYKLSGYLKSNGTEELGFALFNTTNNHWVKEFSHLVAGEHTINESFSIPKNVKNVSAVFYTKQKGPSFEFTIKDLKIEKEKTVFALSMQLPDTNPLKSPENDEFVISPPENDRIIISLFDKEEKIETNETTPLVITTPEPVKNLGWRKVFPWNWFTVVSSSQKGIQLTKEEVEEQIEAVPSVALFIKAANKMKKDNLTDFENLLKIPSKKKGQLVNNDRTIVSSVLKITLEEDTNLLGEEDKLTEKENQILQPYLSRVRETILSKLKLIDVKKTTPTNEVKNLFNNPSESLIFNFNFEEKK